jgi:ASPIC/UnbV protein/VCBS repeat protein/tetratricopeptide repeat protein
MKGPAVVVLLVAGGFAAAGPPLRPPAAAAPSATPPGSASAAKPPLLKHGVDPDQVIRANNRGAALMEQFKHMEALQVFAAMVDQATGWAPGFVNLGLAALYARETDRSGSAFREAIRIDPTLPQAHYGLALLLKTTGRSAEAIEELQKARALDPEDADILYNLGLLFARQRDYAAALPMLRRARQVDPNSMSIRYQLARALIQSGQSGPGQKEMEAYQRLAANPAFAVPTGNQYGEAGRYARVLTDYSAFGLPSAPSNPIVIRFSDATEGSGVRFTHGGPGGEAVLSGRAPVAARPASGKAAGQAAARYGSGVAVADFDGDGLPDLVFANASADGKARPALYRNLGGFRFEDVTSASGVAFEGIGTSALLADLDGDGDRDLVLAGLGRVALFLNDGKGKFSDATVRSKIAVSGLVLGVSGADVDHDGDVDLVLCRIPPPGANDPGGSGLVLLINRGDAIFLDGTAALRFAGPAAGSIGAVFADFDDDHDIDAVVSAASGRDALLDNRRDAGFADRGADAGLPARGAGRGVSAGDLDGDGLADLVFATGAGAPIRVLMNGRGGHFTTRDLPKPAGDSAYGTTLFDADNDGDLDLAAAGSGLRLYLNDGSGRFTDATESSGLGEIAAGDGRAVAAADLDGDGDLDLVMTRNGGPAVLLRNEGGNRNHWLRIDPRGLNSNKDGIGTKIEVQAGARWQRREAQAGSGYLSQSPAAAHFGLADRGLADFVRLLWPGGVLQSELDVAAGQSVEEAELDRKGSSCPLVFAWNGSRFAFVTDALGVGGLGMWMSPGVYGQPRPEEYVKIDPDRLAPRDGAYLLQMLENLEEVTYLDSAQLVVLDHPKGFEVYPNEAFGPPDAAPHRVYTIETKSKIFPRRATDDGGRDVTDRILKIDRLYPDDFHLSRQAGYADMHHITLEFPEAVTRTEGLVLFLYGWVDFEYSSSNYAAHQAGLALESPVLEIEGEDGLFQPRLSPMGFPAGLPRMIAVDLGPSPLPTRKVRIRTNMRVYWDQIFLAPPLPDAEAQERVKVSTALLSGAHLHRRGFPREHSPDGREPKIYDYAILDNTAPFRAMAGGYTKFGRVTDLLTRVDDRFVIFGKGEEVTLEFPTKGLPPQPLGWLRSFLLRLDGYCKDMDPHTAFPDTIEPLPFHGMSAYPYPEGEGYPDDEEHRVYRQTYNTRRVETR